MASRRRMRTRLGIGALVALSATSAATRTTPGHASSGGAGLTGTVTPLAGGATRVASGGAAVNGIDPTHRRPTKLPPPPSRSDRGGWISGFTITEYWPAPERWFVGSLVATPGLRARHRVDWLYSANGVSMEGAGIGLDSRVYHIDALGSGGWLTVGGAPTSSSDGWAAGAPYWRAGGYWRNRSGAVTFPLAAGGWSAGSGLGYVPLPGVRFAPGAGLALRFLRSVAVDPGVIPLGSRVYIPAYRHDGFGGWFLAQDTGGAIDGRHLDVYRSPPPSPASGGRYLRDQRVYVIRPRGS